MVKCCILNGRKCCISIDRSHQSLSQYEFMDVARSSGRTKRYPIGTTAVVPHGKHRLFFTALAHTDINTKKAKADIQDLWNTLEKLWQSVRNNNNGNPIAVPLMGTGLAGISLPYLGVLEVILLSIFAESKKGEIAKEIHVTLTEEVFSRLDLSMLVKEWSE